MTRCQSVKEQRISAVELRVLNDDGVPLTSGGTSLDQSINPQPNAVLDQLARALKTEEVAHFADQLSFRNANLRSQEVEGPIGDLI